MEHLKFSLSRQHPRQLRALILLHIQYHYIAMLVTRPALLMEIAASNSTTVSSRVSAQSTTEASSSRSLASSSVSAEFQILSLIMLLNDFSLLNGISSLDVFYAYLSAMVLLLRTLWAQHTVKHKDIHEEMERKKFFWIL